MLTTGINGLVMWDEREIFQRDYLKSTFALSIYSYLVSLNRAWSIKQVETPILTPLGDINPNYTDGDVWSFPQDQLALRPETTAGSYLYAERLMKEQNAKLPMIIWQVGKSFRREQDKALTNMRLKEFYQQEFQCIYSETTNCDYQSEIAHSLRGMFEWELGKSASVVDSDRLPDYSEKTLDVVVLLGSKWMEVCSFSVRKDFPSIQIQGKVSKPKVLEIAIGLDRCVYARNF